MDHANLNSLIWVMVAESVSNASGLASSILATKFRFQMDETSWLTIRLGIL